MPSADDEYEARNDATGGDVPSGDVADASYVSGSGGEPIPVQSDSKPVEDPIDPATADSDAALARDDAEAIDKSNIIGERTRGAKPAGKYTEPGDTEGLPENDGTSSTR